MTIMDENFDNNTQRCDDNRQIRMVDNNDKMKQHLIPSRRNVYVTAVSMSLKFMDTWCSLFNKLL